MKRTIVVAALTLFISLASGLVCAEKHALLIGVGSYPGLEIKEQLDGPPHDVAALKDLLIGSLGFKPDAVKTLVDEQASRKNIMAALEDLVLNTRAKDIVFIYFTGHGTGGYDLKHKEMGIDPFTGAILPWDFKLDVDIDKMLSGLIIGKRDIRPLLTRLDKDRKVTVIFDACYSEDAVRAIYRGKKKSVGLSLLLSQKAVSSATDSRASTSHGVALEGLLSEAPQKLNQCSIVAPPYPYRNVIYLSASSRNQLALDIGEGMLATGFYKTVDGRPHGAFTDALLRGLQGDGNTDNDNHISYDELYHYVRKDLSRNYNQTPKLLHAANAQLDAAVFENVSTVPRPRQRLIDPDQPLKVKIQGISSNLEKEIAAISKVYMVTDQYDILVRKESDTFALYLGNGGVLADIPAHNPQGVSQRISRQVQVKELVGLTFPDQSFNVFVDVVPAKGVFLVGETLGFVVRPEADCYLLLMNIDPAGNINIIYPYKKQELDMIKKGEKVDLTDLAIVNPPNLGTEYIKALAFKNRPDLSFLMGEAFLPDDPLFKQLMDLVDKEKGLAQATLQVNTADETWLP